MTKCTSCRREHHEGVKISCPKCKKPMFRCAKCRALSVLYKCECSHEGP